MFDFLSSCTASDLHPGPVQGSCQDGEPRSAHPQCRGEAREKVAWWPSLLSSSALARRGTDLLR